MSAFCEDESNWKTYFDAITGPSSNEKLSLHLLEWFSNSTYEPAEITVTSASELITRDRSPHCDLRIVLAPLGASELAERNALCTIFKHYDVPSSFLLDRIQAVTHAFGARLSTTTPNVEVAWSHFLCKDVQSARMEHEPWASDNRTFKDSPRWCRCDAYLHIRKRDDGSRCVTMLCFGAHPKLEGRLRRLLEKADWRDAVQEPFLLLAIVYEELYSMLDSIAWTLADVFRSVERSTLDRAGTQVKNFNIAQTVDFASLHNISKHCTYIYEASEAAMLTVESMITHLQTQRESTSTSLCDVALSHLTYRKSALQSTQLRVRSLEKRMANIISLSFNLVTQQDSRVMQNDSNAMKAIAVLTLIFLPLTGIGSLFSTPFFNVDFDSRGTSLDVATSIWIFWVITVPITLVLFAGWIVWYNTVKEKRSGNSEKMAKTVNTIHVVRTRTWTDRLKLGK